jgi:hypothetical protein
VVGRDDRLPVEPAPGREHPGKAVQVPRGGDEFAVADVEGSRSCVEATAGSSVSTRPSLPWRSAAGNPLVPGVDDLRVSENPGRPKDCFRH